MKTLILMFSSVSIPGLIVTAPPGAEPDPSHALSIELLTIESGEPRGASAAASPMPKVDPGIANARPTEWRSQLRRCHRRGRRFCDGPRMVPVPTAEAKALAEELSLGKSRTARWLLRHPPKAEWVDAAGSQADDSLLWPVDGGRLGRGVGYVRRAALRHIHHDGVDISAALGATVRAVNEGIVTYADNGISGFGNLVMIVHADGSTTMYAHLQEAWVSAGQHVGRGQTIGKLGSSGLSRGPHLHFEWRVNGHPRNPIPHFADRGAGNEQAGAALPLHRLHEA